MKNTKLFKRILVPTLLAVSLLASGGSALAGSGDDPGYVSAPILTPITTLLVAPSGVTWEGFFSPLGVTWE